MRLSTLLDREEDIPLKAFVGGNNTGVFPVDKIDFLNSTVHLGMITDRLDRETSVFHFSKVDLLPYTGEKDAYGDPLYLGDFVYFLAEVRIGHNDTELEEACGVIVESRGGGYCIREVTNKQLGGKEYPLARRGKHRYGSALLVPKVREQVLSHTYPPTEEERLRNARAEKYERAQRQKEYVRRLHNKKGE
jgi:hypothetical protein